MVWCMMASQGVDASLGLRQLAEGLADASAGPSAAFGSLRWAEGLRPGPRPTRGHPGRLFARCGGQTSRYARIWAGPRPRFLSQIAPSRPPAVQSGPFGGVCGARPFRGPAAPRVPGRGRFAARPQRRLRGSPPAFSTPPRTAARVEINGPASGPPLPPPGGRARLTLVRPCGLPLAGPPGRAKCRRCSGPAGLMAGDKRPPYKRPAPPGPSPVGALPWGSPPLPPPVPQPP